MATGYKQTEVGVIPEDWEIEPLESLAHIERGKFTARPRNDPKYYGGNIPFIQTGDVTNSNGWITTYSQTLNQEGLKVSKLFPRGTLFFTIAANIGDVGFADFDTACPDSLVAITPIRRIDKHWLAHELRMRKSLFENLASHNAQLNINLEKLRPYLLPVPTQAEQQAIAEALSDADALIESLEQLLTKKRHIKQGAMQELLTGKKRLPGFGGEWEVKVFSEICWFQEGPGVRNYQFTLSGIKLLNGTNIFRGVINLDSTDRFISENQAHGPYAHFMADAGDIVIASSGISIDRFHEKVAFVNQSNLPFCMNTSTIRFKPYGKYLTSTYLYQFLTSNSFKQQIGGQATGSAQLNFGPSHVAKVTVSLPSLPEQTAIAAILSDMDAEIAALEAKLAKARQIKQGMMRELLTGRIRLV